MRRLATDPHGASADAIRDAASVIAAHGVVAFPTDTLYGLAADPFDANAVERLFLIKGRAEGQAIALVAADLAQVEQWFGRLPDAARRLAGRFWPGPLTLLVGARLKPSRYGLESDGADRSAGRTSAADEIRSVKPSGARPGSAKTSAERLASGIASADGSVGVRVPDHPVARALCYACGRPLTATSANLSGQPASADPDDVALALGDRIDLLLDAGATRGGPPSTIVDATTAELRLVRAGAIDWDTIQTCASRK